jgi:hypothetical protein
MVFLKNTKKKRKLNKIKKKKKTKQTDRADRLQVENFSVFGKHRKQLTFCKSGGIGMYVRNTLSKHVTVIDNERENISYRENTESVVIDSVLINFTSILKFTLFVKIYKHCMTKLKLIYIKSTAITNTSA